MDEKKTTKPSDDEALERGAHAVTREDVDRVANDERTFRDKLEASPATFIEKVGAKLELLMSAVRDYASGSYREVPWLTIALATFAIIYFINPADIIPDLLPLTGFLDDAGVIAAAYGAIVRDLNRYESWKRNQEHREDTGG
jgi:uncharacterized membrane protein YkvA (DUF1232 family)